MRQTQFITEAMQELLIPDLHLSHWDKKDYKSPNVSKVNFKNLQTFPHIGDLVIIYNPKVTYPKLIKVKSIQWTIDNKILISSNRVDPEEVSIDRVAPLAITPMTLAKLGFQYDKKYNKFRLRLLRYPDVVLEQDTLNIDDGYWYVKGMKPIRYIHELQMIFRAFHIDSGLMYQWLSVDHKPINLDWVNDFIP